MDVGDRRGRINLPLSCKGQKGTIYDQGFYQMVEI